MINLQVYFFQYSIAPYYHKIVEELKTIVVFPSDTVKGFCGMLGRSKHFAYGLKTMRTSPSATSVFGTKLVGPIPEGFIAKPKVKLIFA